MTNKWLNWAVELQSIGQCALQYCNDPYDRERFERIREIGAEILSMQAELPLEKVKELFCSETGYQTPKLDCRAAVFQENRILLVQENNGLWSLPGGWVDVDQSVGSNLIKEVREEAGLTVTLDRVIAVQDRERHNQPPYAWKICKIFVLCKAEGGSFQENAETLDAAYFSMEEIPELAEEKVTLSQLQMCFDAYYDPNWKTILE